MYVQGRSLSHAKNAEKNFFCNAKCQSFGVCVAIARNFIQSMSRKYYGLMMPKRSRTLEKFYSKIKWFLKT